MKLCKTVSVQTLSGDMQVSHPTVQQVESLLRINSLRDKLLWMLLAYGGIRGSEALHLFVKDISINTDGTAQIKLKHPSHSLDTIIHTSGKKETLKRISFLKNTYNLNTRNTLSKSNALQVGWKGMYYENRKELTSYVHWITPDIGRKWADLHLQYMELRQPYMSLHPYYFVSLRNSNSKTYGTDKSKGQPLKLGNLRILFQNHSKAAGFTNYTGLNQVHSLRHFYKWVLQDIGKLNEVTIMRCMHHCCLSSTNSYGIPTLTELNNKLSSAYSLLNKSI